MAERNDPEFEYEHEPQRIRKGSSWARSFFKKFGIMSAREERIENADE